MSRKPTTFTQWREQQREYVRRLVQVADRRRALHAWVRMVSPPPIPGRRAGELVYLIPCPHGRGGWARATVTQDEWGHADIVVKCPFCLPTGGALQNYLHKLGAA